MWIIIIIINVTCVVLLKKKNNNNNRKEGRKIAGSSENFLFESCKFWVFLRKRERGEGDNEEKWLLFSSKWMREEGERGGNGTFRRD